MATQTSLTEREANLLWLRLKSGAGGSLETGGPPARPPAGRLIFTEINLEKMPSTELKEKAP
jgi:hypothetical protein